eukprot:m.350050 g.350050  ORF g.350050 m.350050 type:complete len:1958 (+) comp19886_c0_seq3:2025-7898(+)
MAQHIPLFQTQIGAYLDVEKMYTELVRDNQEIVHRVGRAEVTHFVDLLKTKKNPDYLDFLAALCECNGGPLGTHQNMVTEVLLGDPNAGTVYLTELRPEQNVVEVSVSGGKSSDWMSLVKFSEVEGAMDDDDVTSSDNFLFLQKQLRLFSKLCVGRNNTSIHIITKELGYLTWDECFHCATNTKLPKSLRATYVSLMSDLFVDVDPNADLVACIQLGIPFEQLDGEPFAKAADDRTESLSGAKMPAFPALSEWLLSFLKEQTSVVVVDKPNNLLTAEVLRLLKLLVVLGYYVHPDDVKAIVAPLRGLVDGRNDTHMRKKHRQVAFPDDDQVHAVEAKHDKEWRYNGRYKPSSYNLVVASVKQQALEVIDALMNLTFTVRLQLMMYDFRRARDSAGHDFQPRASRRASRRAIEPAPRGARDIPASQMAALMALLSADSEEEVLEHHEEIRNYMDELYKATDWATPGWLPSKKAKKSALCHVLVDLAHYEYPDLLWQAMASMERIYMSQGDLIQLAVSAQMFTTSASNKVLHTVQKSLMPLLRRVCTGFVEPTEMGQFLDAINTLIPMCLLDPKNYAGSPPNPINQMLLFNEGVLFVLCDVLSHDGQQSEVVAATFRLLRVLAIRCPPVQETLFDRLDLLLGVKSPDFKFSKAQGEAIGEIFTDNYRLCIAVKAAHVQTMVRIVSERQVESTSMLQALRAVAKVEELNLPLMRNQALIVKHIMEHRDRIVTIAHIDDKSAASVNAARLRLLEDQLPDPEAEALQKYHCNLVSVFAACAEGENSFIESMCQTIFNVDELLETLLSDFVPLARKAAYMEFFLWVYMITGQSGVHEGLADLGDDPRVVDCLKVILSESMFSPGQALDTEMSKLVYYSFLPFLAKALNDFSPVSPKPEDTQRLEFIASRLNAFATSTLDKLHSKDHIKALSSALVAAHSKAPMFVSADVIQKVAIKLEAGDAGILDSPLIQSFQKHHQDEMAINQLFNKFALNVQTAYAGKNTIETQLPGAGQIANPDEEYCEQGGDEDLLLLPEFQAQLELFVNYSTSKGKRVATGLTEHISVLVRQLQQSQQYGTARDNRKTMRQRRIDINSLQIIRGLLHNEVVLGNETQHLQDTLADQGAVLTVVQLLSHQDSLVVREALSCLVALLRGGNRRAQSVLQDYFMNTRDELFFEAIRTKMRLSGDSVRELRALEAQAEAQREKNATLSGTLTMATKLRAQTNQLLDDVLAQDVGYDEVAAVDEVSVEDEGGLEMVPVAYEVNPLQHSASKPELDFSTKDEGNIELVLRMLSNVVEGHNIVLKGYLQTQPDNIRSIDLVTETVEYLRLIAYHVNEHTISLVIQTLETLVELSQGHENNQRVIFDAQIVDEINFLLRNSNFGEADPFEVAHTKYACCLLLAAMLESNTSATMQTARDISDTVDLLGLRLLMEEYVAVARARGDVAWEPEGEEGPTDASAVAYASYTVLQRLRDLLGQDYLEEGNEEIVREKDDPVLFCQEHSCSIEIFNRGELQKLYFWNKWKKSLRNSVKTELVWGVDRSSPANKIRDFVARSKVVVADLEYLQHVEEFSVFTRTMLSKTSLFDLALIMLTIAIHVLILVSWTASVDPNELLPNFRNSWFTSVLPVVGVIHIVLSALVAITFLMAQPPSLRATLQSLPFGNRIKKFFFPTTGEGHRTETSLLTLEPLYYIALVAFSIAGLFTDGYFYCFHLFHVVVNNQILLRVIQSVTKNGLSLLWVATLMVIVIYTYSMIVFAVFRNKVNPDRDSDLGGFCETAFQCFVTNLKNGLLAGGGLGETLVAEQRVFETFALRAIFDLTFFVLITVIGLNVVFGIIVDTFSELRDESYQIKDAMETECFICSLKSYEFERNGNGFDYHVKNEHNMWDYLCFMLHLKEKPVTEYTAMEAYVADMLSQGRDTAFFPINRALCLDNSQAAEIEEVLERHGLMLEEIAVRLDQLGRMR